MRTARRGRSQRGNVLMEFALAASLLFVLTFGVVDFSRLFNTSNIVSNAAIAGTQYGSMSPAHYGDVAGMQNAALVDAQNPPGITVTARQFCTCGIGGAVVSCPATCNGSSPETYVEVDVSMPFNPAFPYFGIPATNTVASKSVVRVQ